jgi:CTP synthase (UTP-ammonia lyase)
MLVPMSHPLSPPRIALVGDRSDSVKAHSRIPGIIAALSSPGAEPIEPYWVSSTAVESSADVEGFDGVWVVPGSPYESADGVITAIETARRGGIPLLGTCGGFQYILIEFARHVCGLGAAGHAEVDPDGPDLLLVPLVCKLFGEEDEVVIAEGTTAAEAMGAGPTSERYFCRFGLDRSHEPTLTGHGLVISGRDRGGDARVVELPGHPFLVGTLFQPELSSDSTWVHPLIAAFCRAVRERVATKAVA